MIKLLSMAVLCIMLTGCSLLPRITFDKPGVTPTSTQKSNNDERCAGEFKVNKETGEISCSKGYYSKQNNYKQEERKFTLQERIANFIRGLVAWNFWILIALFIFCPGVVGWLIGRVFNVFRSALTGTVKAIGNFKANIPKVTVDGKETYDPAYLKAVDDLFDELETIHAKNPEVIKTIAKIRVELKIEDND